MNKFKYANFTNIIEENQMLHKALFAKSSRKIGRIKQKRIEIF